MPHDAMVYVVVAINVAGILWRGVAAYFDTKSNERMQSERHAENTKALTRIDARLDTLNGTVAKHVTAIALHGQAIENIREKQKDE